MKNEIIVDVATYVPKGSEKVVKAALKKGLEYCIVRCYAAGVFAGYFDRKNKDKNGTVFEARRLWYWDGANSLSQLAKDGVKKPENCKFPTIMPEVDLRDIVEVIPCSETAKKSIESVKIWKI